MIKQYIIERILSSVDIADVIKDYIPIKSSGRNYKCKCPFHDDKDPSMSINTSLGIYKCFSCNKGGNAISFVMEYEAITFPEAIKKIAQKAGVEIKEEEQSPEEIQKNLHREALFNTNELVLSYFQEQLYNSPKALKYLSERWDQDTIKLIGIGYAPCGWDNLSEFARDKGWNLDFLKDLNLIKSGEKGNVYDTYRDRIIFPITNRAGKIEGFTARDISGDKKQAKYINSAESPIYNKTHSLFGFGQAVRTAIKEDRIYIVEGASDAMRLYQLKIYNTVAPLGTGLTEEHLKMIKKICRTVVFINDADDAGIKAVKKHGKAALKIGLNTIVKAIPQGENGEKQDPDSYLVNKPTFDSVPETDFILWYADNSFKPNISQTEISVWVNEIAEMISPIQDITIISQYTDYLAKIHGKVGLWKKAIEQARNTNKRNNSIESQNGLVDLEKVRQYGFWISDNKYFSNGKDSELQWSNFIMTPMFHIKDLINPKRLYRIKNEKGVELFIEFKQEELISISKFKLKLEGMGDFIWEAQERELIKLKKYLYGNTDTATEVTQMGWQRQGFYAFGNGVFDGSFTPADEFGIVRLENGNYYLPSASKIYKDDQQLFQFERRFVHTNFNTISIHDYAVKLIDVFGDNGKVGLCFLFATLFRDIIISTTKSFPILNMFGPKGAGKSELGHSLMSFFIIKNNPPNISNSTIPALADAVAQCSNALVHLDEFKNSMELDKWEYLKGLWDGTGRSRMNMDRDKKRETTNVDAGVMLSGQEMATADIALFSRFIYLCFNQTKYSQEEKRKFDNLKYIDSTGLTHLTIEILSLREKVAQSFMSMYKICLNELLSALENESIEDRIFRNWLIPYTIFKILSPYLKLPWTTDDMLRVTLEGIIRQNNECTANNELSQFWNTLSYLVQEGEVNIESDYRIDHTHKLKTSKANWEGGEARSFLFIRKTRIFKLYQKYGKMVGEKTLPESSLRHYLENSKEFFGYKNSVRFKKVNKIGEDELKVIDSVYQKVSQVDQAMVFDYELIEKNFNIDLRYYTQNDFKDEESL